MIKKNGGIFGRNPTYNDVVVEGVLTLKEAQVFDNDITINGDLIVNGTETVINTVELNVDDKNITMGAVVAKVGLAAMTNITAGQFTVQLADTSGLIPGMTVTKTAGTGAFGVSPKIASVDSHTQITLTVAHATSGTIIFDTGGATDDTADGGGITLKGTTDKFIKWVKASVAWVFSDPIKAPDVTVDNLTASKPVFTDANKKLTSTGTLAIDQGGTGQTTQQAAINALAGAVTAAQFLRGDGTDVKMSAIQASDVPTLNQNTTGNAATATTATTALNLKSNATTGVIQVAGPAAGTTRVMTAPDANFTVARTDAGQTFTGDQAISGNLSTTSSTDANTAATVMTFNKNITNSQASVLVKDTASSASAGFSVNRNGYDAFLRLKATNTSGVLTQYAVLAGENGNLTLDAGNLVIGTSGKGIDFSATSQPSGMTSELLADYEEGTWTPAALDSEGHNFTAGTAIGRYVKVGNQVTASCTFTWSSIGSANASPMILSGLPFASSTATGISQGAALAYLSGFDTVSGTKQITFNLASGASFMNVVQTNDNADITYMPANSASASGRVSLTITYTTF